MADVSIIHNGSTDYNVKDTTSREALAVVENKGAKNYCPKETETSTGSGFTADVEVNIPAGTYILSFNGTLAYTASLSLYRALPHSGNSLDTVNLSATTGAQSVEFTITEAAKYIVFYHNGSGNSLTNIMICTKAEWKISQKFAPYCPTNKGLFDGELQTTSADCVNSLDATYIDKTNSAFFVRKYGKICFLRISLKTVTSSLTGSDIISSTALPEEFRPDVAVYTPVTTRDVGGWAAATLGAAVVTIETNGNVVLRTGTAKTSVAYVTGYVSWYAPNDAVATRSIPSENLSKGVSGTTVEEDSETLKSEVEKTEQEER